MDILKYLQNHDKKYDRDEYCEEFSNATMQIFIKHDKTYTITCNQVDTIAQIKERFYQKVSLYNISTKLTYGGKVLDNDRTLASYNIHKLSTLFVQFRWVS